MNLHFASAGFLAGAFFALLPVILHLLRKKPSEPSIFPSFDFLHGSVLMKLRKNSLRKWLVLLLRILFIILICLAFAWPYFSAGRKDADSATVLLWDNSFSMTSTTYNDELIKKAENIIKKADEKNYVVAGMVSGNSVTWLNDFKSFKKDLWDNFRSASALCCGTNSFHDIFRAASAKLKETDAAKKKIVLISDGHKVPWEKVDLSQKLPPGIELEFIRSEKGVPENVCIENVDDISSSARPGKTILKITLRNYSGKEVNAVLGINIAGSEVAKEPVSIGPGIAAEKIIDIITPLSLPVPGAAEFRILDDIKIDNSFFFSIEKPKARRITVLPPPGRNTDYISLALMTENQGAAHDFSRMDDNTDFIAVQDIAPLEPKDWKGIESFVNNGGSLAFVCTANNAVKEFLKPFGVEVKKTASSKKALRFSSFDFNHPVMKKFTDCGLSGWFEALFFKRAGVELPHDARIIASFSDGAPAIAEISHGGGRLILFCMDLTRKNSTWPAKHTFLPFWQELAKYCGRGKIKKEIFSVGDRPSLKAGEKFIEKIPSVFEKPGNYIISSEDRKRIVSVNVPVVESDTVWLPLDFTKWKEFQREGPIEKDVKDIGTDEDGKEDSIPPAYFFAVAFLIGLCELALSNRTAL